MMNTLQAFQTTLTPNFHVLFNPPRHSLPRTQFLCLSKPRDGNSDSESDPDPPKPEGDTQRQELLARIAMLQTSKVRLTDFLDERSDYLTKFAEEANAEFDKVGEDAMKDLDEASSRILENIESKMQAFEESAGLNRLEIEENDNKLAEFEEQIVEDRNEGLFFKSLRDKQPVDLEKAKEETQKIQEVTKESVGSESRRNIYLGLIGIVALAIADSFVSSPDWRKVAVLGAILVPLLTQFVNEQTLLSEEADKGKGNKKE
ncbi:unnamed protein product [Brassica oleracea var. botrytis]|uniref:BnaCnng24260D protein n=3 Tax=Brassica TaxID=3705 RepID=A0A078ITI2_BRANA|nr:PREDICTED: uncharacterized protein LOC106294943 [Brassica oleracea var. oleracea]XP_022575603.2 uncharacterized protein LOC111215798 [Brassica napus]KAH0881277.1 hypothetical protein HID58_068671 [Brassica napus]CAF1935855.1 unnamed protein product [Brassica napus]CDY53096.1 BnaCnng24260D [Brassica napus]